MADKKSTAARKKHVAPARAEAKRGKREKKAAPEPKKAKAVAKAETPAAKVRRGEKDKAPKQAKKAGKGVEEEEGEDLEGEEGEIETPVPDAGDDEEVAAADVDEDDDDDEDLAPAKKGSKATERKEVKDLLALGRDKGFLTYDEVNDALPSDIVSSDQIDDVMSMFGDNDIAIVDEASNVKLPESTKPAEPELVFEQSMELEYPLTELEPLSFALARLTSNVNALILVFVSLVIGWVPSVLISLFISFATRSFIARRVEGSRTLPRFCEKFIVNGRGRTFMRD